MGIFRYVLYNYQAKALHEIFNPNLALGVRRERPECASDLVTRPGLAWKHHRHTHRYGEERKTDPEYSGQRWRAIRPCNRISNASFGFNIGIRRRVYFIFALMFSLYLLNPVYGQDVTREFHTMQGKIIISGQVDDSLLVIKSENAFISVNYETAEIVIKVNNNSFIPVGSNMIEKPSYNYNTELFFKGKLGIDYMITKKHPFMEFGFDGLLIHKNGEAFVAGNGSLEHIFADEYACILNLEFKVSPDLLGIDWPGHDEVNIRIIRTILKRVNE